MDIQKLLELVSAKAENDARKEGVITLGQLYDKLNLIPKDVRVVMDSGLEPDSLASYRGYYNRLAIGYSQTNTNSETRAVGGGHYMDLSKYGMGDYTTGVAEITVGAATAGELAAALYLADSETFEGYKGGQYMMDHNTLVHAANYGDTGLQVVDVIYVPENNLAIIETQEEQW